MTLEEFVEWALEHRDGCRHRTVIRWNEDGSGFCDACGERVWQIGKREP